jgi:hypothetical protein
MPDSKDAEWNGGKFPNRAPDRDKGMAIEEFVDEDAVNRPQPEQPDRGVGSETTKPEEGKARFGAVLEKALANPMLLVAAAAALPLLLVFWGVSRRRRRRFEEE